MSARLSLVPLAVLGLVLSACQASPDPAPESFPVEVISLEYAESLQTASTLRGLFDGSALRVQVDPRTNSVLLAGPAADLTRAKDVIARLDVEVEANDPRSQVEMIVLEYARATDVEDALNELMQRTSSEFAIDERTNALLVRATPESMVRIKDLIAQLDREQ